MRNFIGTPRIGVPHRRFVGSPAVGLGGRASGPAGPVYDSASDAIIAAFTTPPTTARATLIRDTTRSLVQAGVWDKLDFLHVYAANDSQAALINWKNPGTYNGTLVNSPTFAANIGFTGVATSYIDSAFTPASSPSPKYTLANASAFAWGLKTATDGSGILGEAGVGAIGFYPREPTGGGTIFVRLNVANISGGLTSDGAGFLHASRTNVAGGTVKIYKNGVTLANVTSSVPTANPSTSLRALSIGGISYIGGCAAAGAGSDMTDAENTALYNALRTYMTGVGVP